MRRRGKPCGHGWRSGILAQDDRPAFYVYEILFDVEGPSDISGMEGGRRSLSGLIAQVKLEEFEKGIVLPHEETLSKAKADRFELMRSTACNFSDIYSLYRDDGSESETQDILALVMRQTPLADITDEAGLQHRLWAITDETMIHNHPAALHRYQAVHCGRASPL